MRSSGTCLHSNELMEEEEGEEGKKKEEEEEEKEERRRKEEEGRTWYLACDINPFILKVKSNSQMRLFLETSKST